MRAAFVGGPCRLARAESFDRGPSFAFHSFTFLKLCGRRHNQKPESGKVARGVTQVAACCSDLQLYASEDWPEGGVEGITCRRSPLGLVSNRSGRATLRA